MLRSPAFFLGALISTGLLVACGGSDDDNSFTQPSAGGSGGGGGAAGTATTGGSAGKGTSGSSTTGGSSGSSGTAGSSGSTGGSAGTAGSATSGSSGSAGKATAGAGGSAAGAGGSTAGAAGKGTSGSSGAAGVAGAAGKGTAGTGGTTTAGTGGTSAGTGGTSAGAGGTTAGTGGTTTAGTGGTTTAGTGGTSTAGASGTGGTQGSTCPAPGKTIDGGCFFLLQDMDRSHGAANTACGASLPGAHLAVFASQAQQDAVLSMLGANMGDYWFGLECPAHNNSCNSQMMGVWKWQGGDNPTYADWAGGQPNDGPAGCARLVQGGGNTYSWGDRPCDTPYAAVCSYP